MPFSELSLRSYGRAFYCSLARRGVAKAPFGAPFLGITPGGLMESNPQILIVSSELENRRGLNAILCQEGHDTICASRVSECKEALQTQNVSLIFCHRPLSDANYRDCVPPTRESS